MSAHDDLRYLQQAAVTITAITDRKKRHAAGLWLNRQCEKFEERHRPFDGILRDSEIQIEFRAVLKILIDHIMYDALEDEDWQAIFPESYDGDITALLKGET